MRVLVKVILSEQIVLPITYHHILQSIIYDILSKQDPIVSKWIHDEGFQVKDKKYKPFCMSLLKGFTKHDKILKFNNEVRFYFDSAVDELTEILVKSVTTHGVRFNQKGLEREFPGTVMLIDEPDFTKGFIKVKTLSPIAVSKGEPGSNWKTYFNPLEDEFKSQVRENFHNSFYAVHKTYPTDTIDLKVENIADSNKYVTTYNPKSSSAKITAWSGIFTIKGNAEALRFLYRTGLGEINCQGFGMVEEISKTK